MFSSARPGFSSNTDASRLSVATELEDMRRPNAVSCEKIEKQLICTTGPLRGLGSGGEGTADWLTHG